MHYGAVVTKQNATVHRAAANGFDFRNRAARGSVWNGLFVPSWLGPPEF